MVIRKKLQKVIAKNIRSCGRKLQAIDVHMTLCSCKLDDDDQILDYLEDAASLLLCSIDILNKEIARRQ